MELEKTYMNIIVQETPNTRKIAVQSLDTKADIATLLVAFGTSKNIEISFLNILSLPKKITLSLKNLSDRIKITTNESILKVYLIHLGFYVTYINHYENNTNKLLDLHILALAGSAGSLAKFIEIIHFLPKSDLSIFIVMHQKEDSKNKLAPLLQKYTKNYEVITATNGMKIKPSTIYTAPSNMHLIVENGFIYLNDNIKRNFSRPSISTTFESLSNEYTNKFLAILFCGYGSDGSDVLGLLQKNNSTTIVLDTEECDAKAMLLNAIKTDKIDYCFPLFKIKEFLTNHIKHELFTSEELNEFLGNIEKKYGYDYRGYNFKHIKRRVYLFYTLLKPKSLLEFKNKILNDKNIFKDLLLNISVNVTTFYRNPEVFKILREELLPKLDSYLDIKIWCAGCSSGEEPYSIAIILYELGILKKSLIYATDLNEIILEQAQSGLYSKKNYDTYLQNYYQAGGCESFSQYFNDHDTFVEIKDEFTKNILFFKHNLALDGKMNDFQLIFCRNVLIYFDKDLKAKVYNLFNESLDSYGFIILGESESLQSNQKFKTIDEKYKIYKRNL